MSKKETIEAGLSRVETNLIELLPENLYEPSSNLWLLERSVVVSELPERAGPGVCLKAVRPGPRMRSSAGLCISAIPLDKELTFSCLLRGIRCGQQARVSILAYDAGSKMAMESRTVVALDHKGWTHFNSSFSAPQSTVKLYIWITSFAAQPAFVAQPSLNAETHSGTKGKKKEQYKTEDFSTSTKVIEARYKVPIKTCGGHKRGTITFPIPGPYRGQVPMSFNLQAKPKEALLGYEIKRREDGINWIAEVKVQPPPKGAILSWESLVLIRGEEKRVLPQHAIETPPDTLPWLRSTKCVQSDDKEIKTKAQQLSKNVTSVESYVRKVLQFTSTNRGTGKPFDSLDAKTAMGSGGSCTSKANLAAALLRANGIPARTVSHLPTWMRSYFFEHWLVEYWHPGIGWVWIEPTLDKTQPSSNELVVLAISSRDDEDKCDDPIHLRYLMPGGAYLAGCELSEELEIAEIMKNPAAPNIAVEQSIILGDEVDMSKLFATALQNFEKIKQQKHPKDQSAERTAAIQAAAYDGDADVLAQQLINA